MQKFEFDSKDTKWQVMYISFFFFFFTYSVFTTIPFHLWWASYISAIFPSFYRTSSFVRRAIVDIKRGIASFLLCIVFLIYTEMKIYEYIKISGARNDEFLKIYLREVDIT